MITIVSDWWWLITLTFSRNSLVFFTVLFLLYLNHEQFACLVFHIFFVCLSKKKFFWVKLFFFQYFHPSTRRDVKAEQQLRLTLPRLIFVIVHFFSTHASTRTEQFNAITVNVITVNVITSVSQMSCNDLLRPVSYFFTTCLEKDRTA